MEKGYIYTSGTVSITHIYLFLTAKPLHSNLNVSTFHFSYPSFDLAKPKIQDILLAKKKVCLRGRSSLNSPCPPNNKKIQD